MNRNMNRMGLYGQISTYTQCIKINCFKLELKKSSRKFSKEKNPD